MKYIKTKLEDVFLIEIDKFDDERGYLAKFYDREELKKNIKFSLSQVKFVYTQHKGTIRGLHAQKKPFEEDKIVKCIKGKLFEVVLDLRKSSKAFGKWFGVELSSSDGKSLFVPKGFAHGYQTLSKDTEVLYLMSGKFSKSHNIGYRWDDPHFNINWPLKPTLIAGKDSNWPLFNK